MSAFFEKHRTLTSLLALACLTSAPFAWQAAAGPRGAVAARIDMAQGRHRILWGGLTVVWHWQYSQLLEQRYGIGSEYIGGCLLPDWKWRYAAGYNRQIEKEAVRRFGRDIFSESLIDARKLYYKDANGNSAPVAPSAQIPSDTPQPSFRP